MYFVQRMKKKKKKETKIYLKSLGTKKKDKKETLVM